MAVTAYNNISSQVTEAKMAVHIDRRFPNLCTAVATDDNISSYLTEPEMTMHICVWPCASVPC